MRLPIRYVNAVKAKPDGRQAPGPTTTAAEKQGRHRDPRQGRFIPKLGGLVSYTDAAA